MGEDKRDDINKMKNKTKILQIVLVILKIKIIPIIFKNIYSGQ